MTAVAEHARLSPSGAKRWMQCPASVTMEVGLPEWDTAYADDGTASHELAKWCLTEDKDAAAFLGRVIEVKGVERGEPTIREFEVDEERAENVQIYVDLVRDYAKLGELLVEQRLPIGHITGEDGAEGTGDAVVLTRDDEIIVVDLKYGRGVAVSAESNHQGMLYALGALERYGMLGDFKRVRIVISQPRINPAPSEWACTVDELQAFAKEAADAAQLCRMAAEFKANWYGKAESGYYGPSDDACRFCKAKANCPALAKKVQTDVGADFEDLTALDTPSVEAATSVVDLVPEDPETLAAKMQAIDVIEDWCKAVRAEVERRLLGGKQVPGYKLVQGKRGARAWSDATAVEELLRKTFRLTIEEAYNLKLISPTQAEKVLKDSPKRWAKAQALVTQSEGKPSVAPDSDKRPALVLAPIENDFTNLEDEDVASLV